MPYSAICCAVVHLPLSGVQLLLSVVQLLLPVDAIATEVVIVQLPLPVAAVAMNAIQCYLLYSCHHLPLLSVAAVVTSVVADRAGLSVVQLLLSVITEVVTAYHTVLSAV